MRVVKVSATLWRWRRTRKSLRSSFAPCGIPCLYQSLLFTSKTLILRILLRSSYDARRTVSKSVFSLGTPLFIFFSFFTNAYVSSYILVSRVPQASPIRVLRPSFFGSLPREFELPSYAAEVAHQQAVAASPPSRRMQKFDRGVLPDQDTRPPRRTRR